MRTQWKYLCLLFTVCLAIGVLPGAALAEESEARYSTDGRNWTDASLVDAIWGLYGASTASGQIELKRDVELTNENWVQGCVLAKRDFSLTINGNGHTLRRGPDLTLLSSVNEPGSVVTLQNIVLDGGAVWEGDDPATRVNTGLACEGTASLVTVDRGGKLILESGAVLQNSHITGNMYGAAVSVGTAGSGTLVMRPGAEIRDNAVYSGAVYVWADGEFLMEGGKIHGNYAENNSGAVCVANGAMEMSGGEISGNKAGVGGGGVTVFHPGAQLTMTGGAITGNAIGGTKGGGVLVLNGDMSVSGTPVITGNTGEKGAPNNAYLSSGKTMTIASALSTGASISVTTADALTASATAQIVNGTDRIAFQQYFTSDKGYEFNTDDNGIIQLGNSHTTHVYGTVWQSSDNEHWQVCTVCGQGEKNRATHSGGSDLEHDADFHWNACTVCGARLNEKAHTPGEWVEGDRYHWQNCTVCGAKVNEEAHKPTMDWHPAEDGHWYGCPICGRINDMAEHTFVWTVDQAPTETAPGLQHGVCSVCQYRVDNVTIPATGHVQHVFGTGWTTDEVNHWHVCTAAGCGEIADKAAHAFAWVTDKEPTQTAPGSKHEQCTVCAYAKAPVAVPALPAPTPAASAPGSANVPKTGDSAPLALWLMLLLASGAAVAVLGRRGLKNR